MWPCVRVFVSMLSFLLFSSSFSQECFLLLFFFFFPALPLTFVIHPFHQSHLHIYPSLSPSLNLRFHRLLLYPIGTFHPIFPFLHYILLLLPYFITLHLSSNARPSRPPSFFLFPYLFLFFLASFSPFAIRSFLAIPREILLLALNVLVSLNIFVVFHLSFKGSDLSL